MKNKKYGFAAATIFSAVITLALAGGCASHNAHGQLAGKPSLIQGGIPVEVIQSPVTVTAIDASRRMIILKRDDGSTKIFIVAPAVENFEKLKVGDTVEATVKAQLFVYNGRSLDAEGTADFNAKVLQIDSSRRLLTLQFSNGHTMTILAHADVMLDNMAPGDDAIMRSNEITAIAIKKL